jgi:hypothetical protein
MKKISYLLFAAFACIYLSSCSEDPAPAEPQMVFKFKFDSTQVRLNNFGQPQSIPSNHRAQNPRFNKMSAHYIELAPNALTALGNGAILYTAAQTTTGGSTAIDFSQAISVGEGEVFFSLPLSSVPAGDYEWIRVSLAYQNYDIDYRVNSPVVYDGTGTIASFIGFNTYISNYLIKTQTVTVNANKLQGYWGFETTVPGFPAYVINGQAPPGATTVPNPINSTSPIPAGSCVVTGPFSTPLHITGQETEDVVITLSLSTNGSFEWIESGNNSLYEPLDGDTVIDMGVRGLIPIVE